MTKTAKERIEEEIKDVNRSLVYGRGRHDRACYYAKRQGLTIALAHIQNATTLVTSDDTVTLDKDVYDLLINKVSKQREQLATTVEALENIKIAAKSLDDEAEYNYASEALAEIGGDDE